MIPQTFPSVVDANNRTKMVVYEVPSIVGLTRWIDYIPVKSPASENDLSLANTYDNAGFILSSGLTNVTGLQAFVDYVPIYVDNAATTPWTTDANGYIPLSDLFSIPSLFANGEQGVWYDPSDFTTMFEDTTGSIPIALERPVGLLLDKSKGLALSSELQPNGDFSSGSTGWTVAGDWVIQNNRAEKLTNTANSNLGTSISVEANKSYLVTFDIISVTGQIIVQTASSSNANLIGFTSAGSVRCVITAASVLTGSRVIVFRAVTASTAVIDNVSIKELAGNHAISALASGAKRPTLSAKYNLLVGTTTLATQSVTTLATNYLLSFTGAGSITLSGTKTGTFTAGNNTLSSVTAGTLTLTVTGTVTNAQLIPSDQSSIPYQQVTTSTNYDADATKFPPFLRFDGTDDSMVTSSINFSTTDKVTLWAGLRSINTTNSIVCELSNNFNLAGAFGLSSPSTGGATTVRAYENVALLSATSTVLTPPSTFVVSVSYNNATSGSIQNKINSIDNGSNSGAGGGNFVNQPLYIGARGETSNFFRGNLYSLIIRGVTSTATQISNTETFVNSKTKAY